jgi:hypothetical protein
MFKKKCEAKGLNRGLLKNSGLPTWADDWWPARRGVDARMLRPPSQRAYTTFQPQGPPLVALAFWHQHPSLPATNHRPISIDLEKHRILGNSTYIYVKVPQNGILIRN